jgi:hypothetical protein
VAAPERLSPVERDWLARVQTPSDAGSGRAFVLELAQVTPSKRAAMEAYPADTPARIAWERGLVVITHRQFHAELDPLAGRGTFCRTLSSRAALEVALKVALCSTLPLAGGVPLHAAAVVLGPSAAIFFGPSGAGKSTIAALAGGAVLSDELLAVFGDAGGGVRATGFWGTLNREEAPLQRFPIGGLFELKQEPELRLERLGPQALLRRLLGVTIVPPAPPLWSRAVAVLGRLAESVPGYELGWSKDRPPWEAVSRACLSS